MTGCIWYALDGKIVWIIHVYFQEVIYDVFTREARELTLRTQDRKFSSSLPSSFPSINGHFSCLNRREEEKEWQEVTRKRIFDESCNRFQSPWIQTQSPLRTETWALSIHSSQKWERGEKDETRKEWRQGGEERVAWRRNATFWVGFKTRPSHQSLSRDLRRERKGERESRRVKKNFILSVSILLNQAFRFSSFPQEKCFSFFRSPSSFLVLFLPFLRDPF